MILNIGNKYSKILEIKKFPKIFFILFSFEKEKEKNIFLNIR